jgi:hypothetical protein
MKSRTITIVGATAALAFAAAPLTALAAATAHHRPATASKLDRSRDASGLPHTDKSPDNGKDHADNSIDMRDW